MPPRVAETSHRAVAIRGGLGFSNVLFLGRFGPYSSVFDVFGPKLVLILGKTSPFSSGLGISNT